MVCVRKGLRFVIVALPELFSYLFFAISVIVCLCMYVFGKSLFWIAVWPICRKESVFFWLSA